MKEIILAKSAGFCFGVKRAVETVERAAADGARAVTLGPIIHNRHVVSRFAEMGIREVSDLSEVGDGETVIIRSHGVAKAAYDELERRGIPYIDATCPFVERIHKLVREAEEESRQAIIMGQREHPEVQAIAGWCTHPLVFEEPQELAAWLAEDPSHPEIPISIVFQTTSTKDLSKKSTEIAKKVCTNQYTPFLLLKG